MRANTKKKHGIGKRFAVVIGVAAVGVMALGAQTGAQTQGPTPPPPTCKGLAATIVGTEGSDMAMHGGTAINGTPGPDVIVGLGGDDQITKSNGGNDVICGGDGRDWLDGNRGKDTLLGQAGSDTFTGTKGDRCNGGKGNDRTLQFDPPRVGCEEKSIEHSGVTIH